MERLTKRDCGGNARMNCDDCDLDSSGRCGILQCRNQFIHRLAAYEDTGLEPEDINEFVNSYKTRRDNEEARVRLMCGTGVIHPERAAEITKAESEGRLVVLPCKVGDTVCYLNPFDEIENGKITMIQQKADGTWKFRVTTSFSHDVTIDAIGKSVFRTREEAEAKLKEREK